MSAAEQKTGVPAQETYAHPPIIEAVLDIKTRLPYEASLLPLKDIYHGEEDAYPTVRNPFLVNFKWQREADAEPVTETSVVENGQAWISRDRLQVFQARPDGFTLNRLAPYVSWASFQSEGRRLWAKYRAIARPETIEMLGLTYTNKISLSVGADISSHLNTYIHVPDELPRLLEAHNLFVQMKDPDSGARVAIGMGFQPGNEPGQSAVSINIQAFQNINQPADQVSDEDMWTIFDKLRLLKNMAFESSITDKVRVNFR
jgi:uncharacterized protein (TIGR04255 family)